MGMGSVLTFSRRDHADDSRAEAVLLFAASGHSLGPALMHCLNMSEKAASDWDHSSRFLLAVWEG